MLHVFLIALAPAAALVAARPADGLECVYRTVDRQALTGAARSMQVGSVEDPKAFAALRAAGAACAKRLGWSEKQGLDSALYAMAREGYDEAVAALQGWGVRTPVIEQIAARLTADEKAQILAGNHAPLGTVGVPVMQSSEIVKLARERQDAAARMVGTGVVALLTRDRIAAHFRR